MDYELFKLLGISLGLGLLVGLQREYDNHKVAGIRTFSLVTVFGSIMGLLAQAFDTGWIIASGALSLTLLLAVTNIHRAQSQNPDLGQTTEVALLLMYGLGVYIMYGDTQIAVATGAVTAVLLHLKSTLGEWVDKLKAKDLHAIMKFAAISLVIFPVLPDTTFGPYDVLNPRDIWLMVVLIVGLGLAGYFIYKMLGKNAGSIANGLLGGLISSTATTATFSKRAKANTNIARLAAFIILTASTVALARVLIEVSIVSPQNLHVVAPPLIAELVFMALLCTGLYFYIQKEKIEEIPEPSNPAQLKSALIFAALYALILLGMAAAKDYFGQSGLYVVSVLSGLTDVDAITLSLSHSMNSGQITNTLGWKLILLASLSNLVFKFGLAISLGGKNIFRYLLITFGASVVVGALIIAFWPSGV